MPRISVQASISVSYSDPGAYPIAPVIEIEVRRNRGHTGEAPQRSPHLMSDPEIDAWLNRPEVGLPGLAQDAKRMLSEAHQAVMQRYKSN